MPSAKLPLVGLGDDRARAESALLAVGRQQPTGVVEMEVADRDDVDRVGVEARVAEARQDRLAGHSPLSAVVLVHALADAGLDQHAPGGRLDQQAVERLVERVVGVDLGLDEALPHDRGTGPNDRAGVGREHAGLDQRDPRRRRRGRALQSTVSADHARSLGRPW